MVLLIGGGLSLATAFQRTGLAALIGGQFEAVGALVIATVVYTPGLAVFDIDPGTAPEWAETLAGEGG